MIQTAPLPEFYKILKPSVKPTFDGEIEAMQQQFPNVPLR